MEVPIGTIVAWAGNPATLDSNWKICDGTQVSFQLFPDLCAVIQDYWGPITGVNHDLYTLPNLLGMFLRGVNQGRADAFTDPEQNARTSVDGALLPAARSNQVGSFQADDVRNHSHSIKDNRHTHDFSYRTEGCGPNRGDGGRDIGYEKHEGASTGPSASNIEILASGGRPHGGSETRPANAYVYWIIKARNG